MHVCAAIRWIVGDSYRLVAGSSFAHGAQLWKSCTFPIDSAALSRCRGRIHAPMFRGFREAAHSRTHSSVSCCASHATGERGAQVLIDQGADRPYCRCSGCSRGITPQNSASRPISTIRIPMAVIRPKYIYTSLGIETPPESHAVAARRTKIAIETQPGP